MERARSAEDKARRAEDLLQAAEAVALELGGVRYITLAAVTERAGLHRTGIRRYYTSKEQLLLELAERGWGQWRDAVKAEIAGRTGLTPTQAAAVVSKALTSLPVFCDLLTHAALHLEGDVSIDRARQYKINATAARDDMAAALEQASTLTIEQVVSLLAVAGFLAAGFWQISNPTPTLARLYEEDPRWGHATTDIGPRLDALLATFAIGLAATETPADAR
ncbi:TetR family transcriptional regulator [Microtetraspora sp. NBRC 13810]|uniref:TetR family transcriptional regulator n=1 Tax=Microtetraspora sp. NBRC 13810 TaxID=3030990 RepID=UPI002557207D|nr:TetR family transcriptional regulator [Microtetraspora sp. NBRC 13810]